MENKLLNDLSSPVAVLAPMECEYSILAGKLDNAQSTVNGSFTLTEGTIDGSPVLLVRCMIGMVNSAAATQHIIDRHAPCCVIAQGTAGAHDPALRVNDIILCADNVETANYISDARGRGEGSAIDDWTYPGAELRGEDGEPVRHRTLHSDERLLKIAETVPYPYGNVRRGCSGSADAWNKEQDRILFCHKHMGTDCEEMENFAVAQVCTMHGVPFLGIRVISNNELVPGEEFDPQAAVFCQEYVYEVIRAIRRNF